MTRHSPLETFEIPARTTEVGVVIWMHGLGATNRDFEDLVPILDMPELRFVFPAAPKLPVTINGGFVMPAWYDIVSFDDPPLREDEATVRTGSELVSMLVQREIARGTPAKRIVLMGFSQGGAMALHVGARFPEKLAGMAALSAYLLLPDRWQVERSPANAQTPVLFCHGTSDPVVTYGLAVRAHATLEAAGVPTEFHHFDMEHSMCIDEVQVLKNWLQQRFDGKTA